MLADQQGGNTPHGQSNGSVPDLRELVERVHRQSRLWLDALAPNDFERPHVERLHNLTERLLANPTVPLAGIEQVRKQLCDCCHRLNAGQRYAGCNGRALGYCPILTELAEK